MDSAQGTTSSTPLHHKEQISLLTSRIGAQSSEIINIDGEGDVIVLCGPERMRVSSKILTLRSPVFKAMLKPGFREGNTIRSQQYPLELSLPDDDGLLLLILFQFLHLGFSSQCPDTDLQVKIAQLCHKYDCTVSIRPQSARWLSPYADLSTLQKKFNIALLVDLNVEFPEITAALIKNSSAADIDSLEILLPEPQCLKGLLQKARNRVMLSVIREMENVIDEFRVGRSSYVAERKACPFCGCHDLKDWCAHCKRSTKSIACNAESRLGIFMDLLSDAHIWPLSRHLHGSPEAFITMLFQIEDHFEHDCAGDDDKCPLHKAYHDLTDSPSRLSKALSSVQGLNLKSFKAGLDSSIEDDSSSSEPEFE